MMLTPLLILMSLPALVLVFSQRGGDRHGPAATA
jgi:hypothetical protein